MSFLCWFLQCEWWHHFNTVQRALEANPVEVGVYQCRRCKSISIGAPRRGVMARTDAAEHQGLLQKAPSE